MEKSYLSLFLHVWRETNFFRAILNARFQLRWLIYRKLRIENFIRYYLNTDGRNTFFWVLYKNLYTPFLERSIGPGIDIMSEDWDNLVILDAYRSDYFEKFSRFEGEYKQVVSKGDHSHEFVKKNFSQKHWDLIVVTANVWYEKSPYTSENTFFKLINPASSRSKSHREVTEEAINQIENHPDKRLIIHYMSPHAPFEGELAKKLVRPPWRDLYHMFTNNLINKHTLRQAYIETIEVIESEIEMLLPHLKGKTVITSDHGENLGERQHCFTLHDHGNPSKECRLVPWLVLEFNDRKELKSENPEEYDVLNESDVEKRLEYLGYK